MKILDSYDATNIIIREDNDIRLFFEMLRSVFPFEDSMTLEIIPYREIIEIEDGCLITELIHSRMVNGTELQNFTYLSLSKMLQILNFKRDSSIDNNKYEDFGSKVRERVKVTG